MENTVSGGYLFVHFTGEHPDGEQIYMAISRDGMHWSDHLLFEKAKTLEGNSLSSGVQKSVRYGRDVDTDIVWIPVPAADKISGVRHSACADENSALFAGSRVGR